MKINYTVTGSGETLVLIHGVIHRIHAWDAVIPMLSKKYRVVAMDLPGHGASDPVPEDVEDVYGFLADELEKFIKDVTPDGELAHVVGNSLGGWLALEMGNRGAAKTVTALSPLGFSTFKLERYWANMLFSGLNLLANIFNRFLDSLMADVVVRAIVLSIFFAKPWRKSAETALIDVRGLQTNRIYKRILKRKAAFSKPNQNIKPPVSVVWGLFDVALPVFQSLKVKKTFPNASISYLPVGHVPMSDSPQKITEKIFESCNNLVFFKPAAKKVKNQDLTDVFNFDEPITISEPLPMPDSNQLTKPVQVF